MFVVSFYFLNSFAEFCPAAVNFQIRIPGSGGEGGADGDQKNLQ